MRENPNDRILKREANEQHPSTIPKSCFFRNVLFKQDVSEYHV